MAALAARAFTVDRVGAQPIAPGDVAHLRERFMRFVRVDENGCWIWQGKPNEQGYGRFTYGPNCRIKRYAHRVAYAIFIGIVPAELEVDHRCRRPACVNPEHLQLLTDVANRGRRGLSPEVGEVWQRPAAWGKTDDAAEIPF